MNVDEIRAGYVRLLGHVPANIEARIALADRTNRTDAIVAIEAWRDELLHRNPLPRKTQQLVHLGMLIALGEDMPGALHVRGAIEAGATAEDLQGVAETAAVVGGMPAYSRAVALIAGALDFGGSDG